MRGSFLVDIMAVLPVVYQAADDPVADMAVLFGVW
eukprot:gene2997-3279_t